MDKSNHRSLQTVPFAEIEALLNRAIQAADTSAPSIIRLVGYSPSTWSGWKQKGVAPIRAKYTLLGFMADMDIEPPPPVVEPMFTHEELMVLFSRFLGGSSLVTVDDGMRKQIVAKLAIALSE